MTRRRPLPPAKPSAQEVNVLRASTAAGSVKVAAAELAIAESTAKTHLSRLYRRIGVTDRAQAVAWMDDHQPGWRTDRVQV